ncbi:16779_t:CDS:2, partial [Gigaspora rosea]
MNSSSQSSSMIWHFSKSRSKSQHRCVEAYPSGRAQSFAGGLPIADTCEEPHDFHIRPQNTNLIFDGGCLYIKISNVCLVYVLQVKVNIAGVEAYPSGRAQPFAGGLPIADTCEEPHDFHIRPQNT